jgi:hypothetical protein
VTLGLSTPRAFARVSTEATITVRREASPHRSKRRLVMAAPTTTTCTELDYRSDEFAEVTLIWVTGDGVDETVVCVLAKQEGAYFEISTEPYLALDVFNHPFAYRDFATAIGEQSHRAA